MEQLSFGLEREEDSDGWRWYKKGDKKYISVTKSLEHITHQRFARAMVQAKPEEWREKAQKTANIGITIEGLVTADLKGELNLIPKEYEPHVEGWKKIKKEFEIEATSSQVQVYSDLYGYAGTIDLIGSVRGHPAIMDIKSGYISPKAAQQECAYAIALSEIQDKNWEEFDLVTLSIHRDGTVRDPFITVHKDWVARQYFAALQSFKGLYFSKLQKMNYQWLHDDAYEKYLQRRTP